jgi:hypothetical protein
MSLFEWIDFSSNPLTSGKIAEPGNGYLLEVVTTE